MLKHIVIAFAIVLAISILYTVVVTRKIVMPLKQLTAVAERIATSDMHEDASDIQIESNDEIGTLSRVLTDTYTKIQEYTSYINALAYRDSLTGIKNTTAYKEEVAKLDIDIAVNKPIFGIIVADINNLKNTNDLYGHDVGNELIIHTAKIITNTFKNSPVFRIGGDEFVVILSGSDCARQHELIEEFDNACKSDFISFDDHVIPVSVARGIAIFDKNTARKGILTSAVILLHRMNDCILKQ